MRSEKEVRRRSACDYCGCEERERVYVNVKRNAKGNIIAIKFNYYI